MVGICVVGSLEISSKMATILAKGEGLAAIYELKDTLTKELPEAVFGFYHDQGIRQQQVIGQEIVFRINFINVEQGMASRSHLVDRACVYYLATHSEES